MSNYYDFPCPKCKKKKVKKFVYGYIGSPEDLSSKEIPGGCIITYNNPKWYCKNCGHEWGRSKDF